LDVGIGDIVLDPLERIHTRDWFAFAEILPASVPMIPREQQFAEKLHAYLREDRIVRNTRPGEGDRSGLGDGASGFAKRVGRFTPRMSLRTR
jgi:Nucleotidyl transferase AbiEii toxin, Type IV TA system